MKTEKAKEEERTKENGKMGEIDKNKRIKHSGIIITKKKEN